MINEYERAKQSRNDYEKIVFEKADGTSSFDKNKDKYINFIKVMNRKIESLESKINELSDLIEIDGDFSIEMKIDELLKNEHILNERKDF